MVCVLDSNGDDKFKMNDDSVLVSERNEYKMKISKGYKPWLLEEYRKHRDSELWRATRIIEELCEYALYLEGVVNNE